MSERKAWVYKRNTTTGKIHVRLSAFLSEMKGWFYKSNSTTGIIHVRLAAFLSEMKGWFYKSNSTTGIIHVRLAAFLSEMKGWFYKSSSTTGIIHVRLAAFLSERNQWFYKSIKDPFICLPVLVRTVERLLLLQSETQGKAFIRAENVTNRNNLTLLYSRLHLLPTCNHICHRMVEWLPCRLVQVCRRLCL